MLNALSFVLAATHGRPVQQNRYCTLKFVPLVTLGIRVKRQSAAMWTHWEGLRSLSESALQAGRLNRLRKQRRHLHNDDGGNPAEENS